MGPKRPSDAPLRVLQVVSSARRRGAEVFAFQLGEQLGVLGMQVATIALEPTDDPSDLPFIQPQHSRFDPRTIARLARLARKSDVVISHAGSTLLPTAIAATIARRPYVFRNISDPAVWGKVRGADLRLGIPLRHAAHVVALYSKAGEYLETTYRLDAAKVTVASNAVDAKRFDRRTDASKQAARDELGLGADPVVGCLGALVREKRPSWAIQVAQELPSIELLMAGGGPLRPELEQQVAKAGIGSRVKFLGSLSDPKPFLDAIDVLLLTSETEGVPGVILEAAMVGLPVVATDVGGVGEIITEMGAGIAVPVDDRAALVSGLIKVLRYPEDFMALRSQLEPRFDIGSVAGMWAGILESVTDR